MRKSGQGASGEGHKHPYLRHEMYEDLFGHLEKPISSPEWLQRMDTQRELIAKSRKMDGLHLSQMKRSV